MVLENKGCHNNSSTYWLILVVSSSPSLLVKLKSLWNWYYIILLIFCPFQIKEISLMLEYIFRHKKSHLNTKYSQVNISMTWAFNVCLSLIHHYKSWFFELGYCKVSSSFVFHWHAQHVIFIFIVQLCTTIGSKVPL